MSANPRSGPAYSPETSVLAMRLMHHAHEAWAAGEAQLLDGSGDFPWPSEMYGWAVGVVTWATALDELLDAPGGGYLDYPSRRPDGEQLLDAARYARHRAVHQLIPLAEEQAGYVAPFTFPLKQKARPYRWAPMSVMPAREDEPDGQRATAIRAAYADRWAGNEMSPSLRELVNWFRTFDLPPQ